jgi:hypothetical protein
MFKFGLKAVTLIFILCLGLSATSQQRQVKRDSLTIADSIRGQIEFEYDTSKGDKVFDGRFSFQSVYQSSVEDYNFEAITYKGQYSSDLKNGNWTYSYKKLNPRDRKYVEDFKIGNLASGIEQNVLGDFQKGKASGKWIATKQRYVDSEIEDTLLYVTTTFKNNTLSGRFKSESPVIDLSGYFNADGYFHGEWEVNYKTSDLPIKEVRTYEAGVLTDYKLEYKGKVLDMVYSGLDTSISNNENWVDFDIQDGYFDILKLANLEAKQSVSSSIAFMVDKQSQSTNEFIRRSIFSFSFRSGNDIWQNIKGSEPIGLGKFKVRKFEFSTQERNKIQKILSSFNQIESTLKNFKEHPKFKLGKPVYEKLNEIELIFSVYRNDLSQLKSMVDVMGSDAFEYINRQNVFNNIWPELRFPVEVTYEFQSKLITKTHAFPKQPRKDDFGLDEAYALLQAIEEDVKILGEEAKVIFQNMEAEKSLSRDEKKLISKKEEVENLFNNSDAESFNAYHKLYRNLILNLSQKTFNTYGAYSLDLKKKNIQDVLSCFERMSEFYTFLEKLKAKDTKLDDVYTRTTFNPYVMVDMSERIKENLYKAFVDNLQPYFLNSLENNFNCGNLESAMSDINKAYQKMLDLSKQDTKAIEKELKRQNDPEQILSILELQSQY